MVVETWNFVKVNQAKKVSETTSGKKFLWVAAAAAGSVRGGGTFPLLRLHLLKKKNGASAFQFWKKV